MAFVVTSYPREDRLLFGRGTKERTISQPKVQRSTLRLIIRFESAGPVTSRRKTSDLVHE
jgi:hypothetical protein